mmetsp:Transcript_37089/g.87726  ORF Transcript_37089/g.87726 Transcript_37089/m.87726 type:complete len:182 (+) Transcript_37089:169-714(+)
MWRSGFTGATLSLLATALAFREPPQSLQLRPLRASGSCGHVGAADGYRGALASPAAVPVLALRGGSGGSSVSVERFSFPGRAGVKTVCVAGDWNGWVKTPLVLGKDGVWALEMNVAAGLHIYKYILNGWDEVVNEAEPMVSDGSGGVGNALGVRVHTFEFQYPKFTGFSKLSDAVSGVFRR